MSERPKGGWRNWVRQNGGKKNEAYVVQLLIHRQPSTLRKNDSLSHPRSLILPIPQGALRGEKWIVRSGNLECHLGTYEYNKQKLLCRSVLPAETVYDVGAHVGFYTLLASQLVGSEGRVIAFEPFSRNQVLLKRHLEMNKSQNVIVIEAAVAEMDGVFKFLEGSTSSTGRLSQSGSFNVEAVAIDGLVSRGRIPLPTQSRWI